MENEAEIKSVYKTLFDLADHDIVNVQRHIRTDVGKFRYVESYEYVKMTAKEYKEFVLKHIRVEQHALIKSGGDWIHDPSDEYYRSM